MIAKVKNQYFSYNLTKYDNILDDPNNKIGSFLSRFITWLVILFAGTFIFESIWNNEVVYASELYIFDAVVSIIFAMEYLYRIIRIKDKISFAANPIRIIDLFSFIPFFFWLLPVWDLIKLLRLMRVLRVLRLIKKIPLTAGFITALKDYKDEYKAVFILFSVILFIGSSFVYYFEKDVTGTLFTSIPMTLWWGLVTMTTVWFWDMYPVTNFGRIAWSFLVLLWPIVLALTSAVTIMVFMETTKIQELQREHHRWKTCQRCKARNQKIANYCMVCGECFDEVIHTKK